MKLNVWNGFESRKTPGSGRRIVQLTNGEGTCYPLYYYIPTFSSDGKKLIYHRAEGGNLQIHALELETGNSRQLTWGDYPETRWVPWCYESGVGVLDHRSVLDQSRDRVIYFNGNEVRWVDLNGMDDSLLFHLPKGRIATGQNCVSKDGNWFVYIHHDQALFEQVYPTINGATARHAESLREKSKGTVLAAYHFESGENKVLLQINSPIHHVNSTLDNQLLFCHPTNENGMFLTDLEGGRYSHLRSQDSSGGCICHYVVSERGIAYEVQGVSGPNRFGLFNHQTGKKYELPLPNAFGYTHTGRDPKGLLWIFENQTPQLHELQFLEKHDPVNGDTWVPLTGDWPTFGEGQKSHFHPQVTPDRRWLLMTGGCSKTKSNHLFLIEISDLQPTSGIPKI